MQENIVSMQGWASLLFGVALLHTFSVIYFNKLARRFKEGSVGENLFHFLGEVEVVFGLYAGLLILLWSIKFGSADAIRYLESVQFTEPAFVFVIMCIAATKPILDFVAKLIEVATIAIPAPPLIANYFILLAVAPLIGSLITEPAAMTVTALLLRETIFSHKLSKQLKYATLALLFVNVSIGGALTHFAAPPVVMVSKTWGWDTPFMLRTFGYHVLIAVIATTALTMLVFKKELSALAALTKSNAKSKKKLEKKSTAPLWLVAVHLLFLTLTVLHSHHMAFFIPLFLFFLGWCAISAEHQTELKLRESLLVAFFLGGLVTLGKLQEWWLSPLLSGLETTALFWSAIGLTAITDNAAITYLATLVDGLSESAKYAVVAGAITGGGLTVIANAPNPVGYSILRDKFGADGVSAPKLFVAALPLTVIVALIFEFL